MNRSEAQLALQKTGSVLFAGLVIALSAPLDAGTLSVSPVRVQLGSDGRAEVVELTNPGQSSTLVQLQAFAWVDATSVDGLQSTDDLIAVPPVFELAPDASQVIRLALRDTAPSNIEKTYRLLITEVPREVGENTDAITFAMRFNLPVFVTPQGAAPDPAWSLRRTANGTALVIANRGTAHIKLDSFQLLKGGGDDAIFSLVPGEYVLAGQEHSWPLDLPATQLDGPLTLKAETNIGPLETTVSWPEG